MSLDISSGLFAHNERKMRPMVFGEVRFDHFTDRAVLGGAPFNVAWNLKGFGLNPLMLTAIGHDDEGESVRQQMNRWEMDVGGVQVTEDYPNISLPLKLYVNRNLQSRASSSLATTSTRTDFW